MRQNQLLLLVAALTLTACGSSSDDSNALDWHRVNEPAGADRGLVWADRQTGDIHLPDGKTLAADQPITSFVVAGGGAYVVEKDDQKIVAVTEDGPEATGAHAGGLKASPDGRFLAFIDTQAGPLFQEMPKGNHVHLLTSVVVDLTTGKEVFRSSRGMGDPESDDLTDLYEDASYGVLGLTDTTAWIEPATGDVLEIDLESGKVTALPDVAVPDEKNPWVQPKAPPPIGGDWNADRSWSIKKVSTHDPAVDPDPASRQSRDVLVRADGTELVPRPGTVNWSFDRWLDPTTVVGVADANLEKPDSLGTLLPSSLLTCTVPDGACTIIPDSSRAILPAPSLY